MTRERVQASETNSGTATDSRPTHRSGRVTSIDALRGLVMFAMIFVNYLAGAGEIVPDGMVHFSDRHPHASGMTFVDVVFPAFLFIVGMSVPFALGARLARGEARWRTLVHILVRTLALLSIGVLMVNGRPDAQRLGWSPKLWQTLMYLAAILAFSVISPPNRPRLPTRPWRILSLTCRVLGLATLVWLAFAWRGGDGERIITLWPFTLRTQWWGILGLIGWAYLVGSIIHLVFGAHRTALLGCLSLLLCLYAADRTGLFHGLWLRSVIGIGDTLGSLPAITVAGMLLASILTSTEAMRPAARIRFAALFMAGTAAGALLLEGLYGISKDRATPSWCLWACAITAATWLVFHVICDMRGEAQDARATARVRGARTVTGALSVAGRNVLLVYLISNVLPSAFDLLGQGWFWGILQSGLTAAILTSAACGVLILGASAGLNRMGFTLRL